MDWPSTSPGTDKKPSKDTCQFSTCDTKVTIRAWVQAVRSLDVVIVDHEVETLHEVQPTSYREADAQETWLCFEHNIQVRDAAKRPSLTVRRSVQGWLWIDNLEHLRFAA